MRGSRRAFVPRLIRRLFWPLRVPHSPAAAAPCVLGPLRAAAPAAASPSARGPGFAGPAPLARPPGFKAAVLVRACALRGRQRGRRACLRLPFAAGFLRCALGRPCSGQPRLCPSRPSPGLPRAAPCGALPLGASGAAMAPGPGAERGRWPRFLGAAPPGPVLGRLRGLRGRVAPSRPFLTRLVSPLRPPAPPPPLGAPGSARLSPWGCRPRAAPVPAFLQAGLDKRAAL